MSSLRHRRIRRWITPYLDGELDRARARAVADHLEDCWGCSGDVSTLRLVKHSLGGLGARTPTSLAGARLRRWAADLSG